MTEKSLLKCRVQCILVKQFLLQQPRLTQKQSSVQKTAKQIQERDGIDVSHFACGFTRTMPGVLCNVLNLYAKDY